MVSCLGLTRIAVVAYLTVPFALSGSCGTAAGEDLVTGEAGAQPAICTYDTYKWNVRQMKTVARERIEKPYSAVTLVERDPGTGCSVCLEEQVEIRLEGVAPFRVCRHIAEKAESTLRELQAQGVPILTVVGYRVGMTRGDADAEGNRTRFSNHSFGVALDINEAENGLYESCQEIGPKCRLRKGGAWKPDTNPLSMMAIHPVVTAMKRAGFRWGGELVGAQKDFMHFSQSDD